MEPHGRFVLVGHRRVPCEDRVRLALHEPPVDRADAVLLEDRQARLEEAVARARHVLGADHRPPLRLQGLDVRLEPVGRVVVVEGDDVRVREHELVAHRVVVPEPRRDRLRRVRLLRPCEDRLEQRHHRVHVARVRRLVEEVPREDPLVLAEALEDVLRVALEPAPCARVEEPLRARRADPPGIVRARLRRRLLSGLRVVVPARVEEHEYGLDVVLVGDRQVVADALLEPGGVLLPRDVVQVDAHRVHPDPRGKAELAIDRLGIERVRLPHLELVDGRTRNEVRPDRPRLLAVPLVRLLGRPARLGASNR